MMIPDYTMEEQATFILMTSDGLGFPLTEEETVTLMAIALGVRSILNMEAAEEFITGFYRPIGAWIEGVHPDLAKSLEEEHGGGE
jgi:hypothetical protein